MHPQPPLAVYYQLVRSPYFVIVHTRFREGHDRFDQYASRPDGLVELTKTVLDHVTAGRFEILDEVCGMDERDKQKSSHRERRYIAKCAEETYLPVEYRGYWLSTNSDKTQAFTVMELACSAASVAWLTVAKFQALAGRAG